jgi:ribulose-phosphate 3-epimerase
MPEKPIISASILSADFSNLGDQIKQLEHAGADWVHIDVMDGHFVPNISMGPFIVETVRRLTALPLDVHLMIEKPERYLADFARAGANVISVQVETCPHLHRTLQQIHELGCQAGVVLNPGTPACLVKPVLHLADLVLVMSVNPGFSGQAFLPEVLPKAAELRQALKELGSGAVIEMDGGIAAATVKAAYQSGVQVFVAATSIFKHPEGIAGGVRALRNAIEG